MQPTNPQIQHTMSNPRWSVPSATTEGTGYTITVDANGERVCSCKANDYPKTRGKCWHLKAVNAGLVKPRIRVSQRPASKVAPKTPENRDFGLPAFTHARTSAEGQAFVTMLDI